MYNTHLQWKYLVVICKKLRQVYVPLCRVFLMRISKFCFSLPFFNAVNNYPLKTRSLIKYSRSTPKTQNTINTLQTPSSLNFHTCYQQWHATKQAIQGMTTSHLRNRFCTKQNIPIQLVYVCIHVCICVCVCGIRLWIYVCVYVHKKNCRHWVGCSPPFRTCQPANPTSLTYGFSLRTLHTEAIVQKQSVVFSSVRVEFCE